MTPELSHWHKHKAIDVRWHKAKPQWRRGLRVGPRPVHRPCPAPPSPCIGSLFCALCFYAAAQKRQNAESIAGNFIIQICVTVNVSRAKSVLTDWLADWLTDWVTDRLFSMTGTSRTDRGPWTLARIGSSSQTKALPLSAASVACLFALQLITLRFPHWRLH